MKRILGWLGGAGPVALAAAGGILWGLCFQRQPLVVLPWLALAPLVLLLGAERPGRLGFVHGLAAWLVAIPWLVATLHSYGGLPVWLALLPFGLLVAYLAAYQAAFAYLGAALWRRGGATALVGLPALWVGLEWLRTWFLGGFPWNLAAYAWVEAPGALALSAWVGSYGLSGLVVLSGVGVALAIRRRSWRPAAATVLGILTVLGFGARWANGTPVESLPRPARVVQPNIATLTVPDAAAIDAGYRRLLELSDRACDGPATLIVWPESATWPYSYPQHERLEADVAALAARSCPVLLNTAAVTSRGLTNAALLVDGSGPAQRYEKRHLVPFGEFVPLEKALPFVGTLARAAGRFVPGTEPALLEWGSESIGTAICYEIVFPGETAELVRAGATILVTITNDDWYGDTAAPWQHFRAARFRAAESRRPVLRAAITGVSGVIAADGSVQSRLGVGEEGVLWTMVTPRADLSPYTRAPWIIPLLAVLLALACGLVELRRAR